MRLFTNRSSKSAQTFTIRLSSTLYIYTLEFGTRLHEVFGDRVLGPDKPSVARVKTLHIRKIMLKLENGLDYKLAKQYLRSIRDTMIKEKHYGALSIYFDVDPL